MLLVLFGEIQIVHCICLEQPLLLPLLLSDDAVAAVAAVAAVMVVAAVAVSVAVVPNYFVSSTTAAVHEAVGNNTFGHGSC